MKNINSIINGVLGAAVIALFVLYFTDGDKSDVHAASASSDSALVQSGDLSIAYFNVDSVLSNWNLYFQMQEELAARQTSLESEFAGKQQSFMSRVEDAQYKIQRGLVTRAESEQLQQQLSQEEQNLMTLQNQFSMQLQEEGAVKNRQMIDKIEQYLKKFNETAGYTYIFSYSFGGNLLYGDDAFNITAAVISGINEEYAVEESK
jgi:outer membrane protein